MLWFLLLFLVSTASPIEHSERGQPEMSGAKSQVTHVSELALAPKLYRLKKAFG